MDNQHYKEAVDKLLSRVGKLDWEGSCGDGELNRRVFDFGASLSVWGKEKKIALEFKSNGEPRTIAQFVGQIRGESRDECYPIIVAPYIGERSRQLCESSDVGCIDLSGNAYLSFEGVFIDRRGNENRFKERRIQREILTRKSTWIIRCMLSAPSRSWTMSELAGDSGVSIAQVYKSLARLEVENFVRKDRGAIRLTDPKALLDLWANRYDFRDQRITGYFSPYKGYEELFTVLRDVPAQSYAVTMGAAAQLVLPTVRTSDFYVYSEAFETLRDALRLEEVDLGGNVFVIEPVDESVLRGRQLVDGIGIVSSLQLYLDLFNYPQRGREQADEIRSKILGV